MTEEVKCRVCSEVKNVCPYCEVCADHHAIPTWENPEGSCDTDEEIARQKAWYEERKNEKINNN